MSVALVSSKFSLCCQQWDSVLRVTCRIAACSVIYEHNTKRSKFSHLRRELCCPLPNTTDSTLLLCIIRQSGWQWEPVSNWLFRIELFSDDSRLESCTLMASADFHRESCGNIAVVNVWTLSLNWRLPTSILEKQVTEVDKTGTKDVRGLFGISAVNLIGEIVPACNFIKVSAKSGHNLLRRCTSITVQRRIWKKGLILGVTHPHVRYNKL